MTFAQLMALVADEPVFDTGLLLAGAVDPADVRRQLSRWTRAGRVHQLRRGLYALAPPYQKTAPHPFVVANRMVRASYVSCQSTLAHYGLIPELAPVTTSVTTDRPRTWSTPLGTFSYRHLQIGLFHGYARVNLGRQQHGFIALPEKALLDLIYLESVGDLHPFLTELRLQNLDRLDLDRLCQLAEGSGRAKLRRAADIVVDLAHAERDAYVELPAEP